MTSQSGVITGGDIGWRIRNTYSQLPSILFTPAESADVRDPRLLLLNEPLAAELGLNFASRSPSDLAATFSGQTLPPGAKPIAQAYAGHQFGGFTMLGDGRAILIGEQETPDGRLLDLQLKGAGRTRYSRGGDGLAAVGPMLREYIISEAMSALGIPTTRGLAVVATGEPVYRSKVLPGAILTRVAASHIRVGTFEYLAAIQDSAALQALADYTINRHYPEFSDGPGKYLQFYQAVIDRQAALIARWQLVGFIHGVMNTDNMAISGETIDYGPCAFMNVFRQDTVFSSIDSAGRYAYGNQPAIGQWNLARFGQALLPLIAADREQAAAAASEILRDYPARFERYWLSGMRKKLGLEIDEEDDIGLIRMLLEWMERSKADWTNTFRDLSITEVPSAERYQSPEFQEWFAQWRRRLERESRPNMSRCEEMLRVNPAVIPRNHRVEEAISAAENSADISIGRRLLDALRSPFESTIENKIYQNPPDDECGYRTFCGT